MASDIRIRWLLDVVDKGAGKKLLKQDREIRRGLQQTDRQYKTMGTTATSVAARQVQASTRVARGLTGVQRAATPASAEVRKYAAAQREAATAAQRIISQSSRVESAYKRQARAAQESARVQKTATAAAKGGGAAAGAAGGLATRGAGLAATAGLSVGLVAATRDSVGFEKTMANVQARLLTTGKNMSRLSDFAIQLGAKTQFSAGQAAQAMDVLASQGFTVNQIFKVLPGTLALAAASSTDLAEAADIQSAALRGFGLRAKDAAHVADVLAQTTNLSAASMADLGETLPYVASTARVTRTSFEQVAAAAGILANAGIKGSSAGTALRTSMLRLTSPTKKMRESLTSIGIEASSLAAIPLPSVIGKLAEKLKGVPRGRAVGIIATVFGKEAAPSIFNLMSKGEKQIDSMTSSLLKSRGAAKRAADIMRNTVAGAWDNFTGSVETASIKLTRRFLPALKGVLNAGAGGVNRGTEALLKSAPAVAAGIGAGLRGEGVQGKLIRGPQGRVEGREDPSKAAQVGQKIGEVARTIGATAATAGKQLLDAFKPAMPFFQNILLPLLAGVGKGILVSVVAAFKIAIPIITVVSKVLGGIGTAARPLKPLFQGIGTVIGFVLAGPILKLLGGIGKIGIVFRALALPLRATAGFFAMFGRGVLGAVKFLARLNPAVLATKLVIAKVPVIIASVVGKAAAAAKSVASAILKAFDVLKSLPGRVFSLFGRLGDRFTGIASIVGGRAKKIGSGLIGGVVSGIRQAGGAIADVMASLAKSAYDKVKGGGVPFVPGIRTGGRITTRGVRRYGAGGLVPSFVSSGERIVEPNGSTWTVPGRPTAADNVFAPLRPGTAVLTSDGQARMAAGASITDALRDQAPHFATGGIVKRSRTRGGLIGDALSQGVDAGASGLTRTEIARARHGSRGAENNPILAAIREATQASAKKASKAAGGGTPRMQKMNAFAASAAKRFPKYSYGGGHGGFGGPYDCSGFVSAILHAGNFLGSPMTTDGLKNWGDKNSGKLITVGVRGSTGRNAHTMIRVGSAYWEAGSHGVGRRSGWSGSFPVRRHPHNYRRGGVVPKRIAERIRRHPDVLDPSSPDFVGFGLRRGGVIPGFRFGGYAIPAPRSSGVSHALNTGVSRALSSKSGSLASLDATIGAAAEFKLEQLRKTILSRARAGGPKKTIQRLQSVLSLIDFEIGRRIGTLAATIAQRTTRVDRGQGGIDRGLRKIGVDASSAKGLAIQGAYDTKAVDSRRKNVTDARRALTLAKRSGSKTQITAATDQLNTALDDLDEAITKRIEDRRAFVITKAQDRVDTAQFGIDVTNNALGGIDIAQRLNRTAESPEGMVQKAQAIQSQLLPALQNSLTAYQQQFAALSSIGDTAGARGAFTAIQTAGNDIATAMADAAELVRNAALTAAQNTVDNAQHVGTIADLGLQHLELEQRVAGTFDTGGQARADFINSQIIPALNAELAALQAQAATAAAQGDKVLADQIGEAVAAKQNEVLQAQVDATEQVAANTEPLKDFDGSLGFEFQSQGFTDLAGVGIGV